MLHGLNWHTAQFFSSNVSYVWEKNKMNESTHSEMGPVWQTPIQRIIRTAHLNVLMTVHNFSTQYNTEQFWKSLLLPTDNDHSSDVVYRRRGDKNSRGGGRRERLPTAKSVYWSRRSPNRRVDSVNSCCFVWQSERRQENGSTSGYERDDSDLPSPTPTYFCSQVTAHLPTSLRCTLFCLRNGRQ